jgi:hypothetical protein
VGDGRALMRVTVQEEPSGEYLMSYELDGKMVLLLGSAGIPLDLRLEVQMMGHEADARTLLERIARGCVRPWDWSEPKKTPKQGYIGRIAGGGRNPWQEAYMGARTGRFYHGGHTNQRSWEDDG